MGRNLAILAATAMLLATGCAKPQSTASLDPAYHELPTLNLRENTLPADIRVEGQTDWPTGLLVQKMPEPEATPEEKQKLGEKPEEIDFLVLYQPPLGPQQGVYPFDTGVKTNINGAAGPQFKVIDTRSSVSLWGEAGVQTGTYPVALTRTSVYGPRLPNGTLGPTEQVDIGYNPASYKSGHRTRIRP